MPRDYANSSDADFVVADKNSMASLLCLLLAPTASAWVTSAQRIYGAQLEWIQEEQRGNATHEPEVSLRLWSLPRAQEDPLGSSIGTGRGLDGGITWAWDDGLCAHLQPYLHESVLGLNLADCDSLKAAMHRAFDSWAANHRLISFVDVTAECEKLSPTGRVNMTAGCPLAEIMVGPRPPSDCSSDAAQAKPRGYYSESFRYTNGAFAREWDGVTASFRSRRVIETRGGLIRFGGARTECDPICW